jgi:DnaK suppressor protein
MEEKKKLAYSAEELKEFEEIILKKLEKAKVEFNNLKSTLSKDGDSGSEASSAYAKVMEDGADTAEKENLSQLAARQQKFINSLENALIRIKNGTYGICVDTNELIPKEATACSTTHHALHRGKIEPALVWIFFKTMSKH